MMTPEQAIADLRGNCDHYLDAPPDCWYCKVAAVITSQQSILKDALRSEQNFQNKLGDALLKLDELYTAIRIVGSSESAEEMWSAFESLEKLLPKQTK